MKLLFTLIGTVIVALVIVVGGRYYVFVTNTLSPYDDVGITLNGYMPAQVRAWDCSKLKATFGKSALPPLGCAAADAKTWM